MTINCSECKGAVSDPWRCAACGGYCCSQICLQKHLDQGYQLCLVLKLRKADARIAKQGEIILAQTGRIIELRQLAETVERMVGTQPEELWQALHTLSSIKQLLIPMLAEEEPTNG